MKFLTFGPYWVKEWLKGHLISTVAMFPGFMTSLAQGLTPCKAVAFTSIWVALQLVLLSAAYWLWRTRYKDPGNEGQKSKG
jgi:hypothetical protein